MGHTQRTAAQLAGRRGNRSSLKTWGCRAAKNPRVQARVAEYEQGRSPEHKLPHPDSVPKGKGARLATSRAAKAARSQPSPRHPDESRPVGAGEWGKPGGLQQWCHEFVVSEMAPKYIPGQFHLHLIDDLEWYIGEVEAERDPRLMIFGPPRHGKTEHSQVQVTTWAMRDHPDWLFMGIGHSQTLVVDHTSARMRDIVMSERFRELGGSALRPDRQGLTEWRFPEGGGFIPAGLNSGKPMGRGAKSLGIDDFYKNEQQAYSPAARAKTLAQIRMLHDRVLPGGGVVYNVHRWHGEDAVGEMMAAADRGDIPPFRIINYPAVATEDEGWRKNGEALWPEIWPLDRLEMKRREAGPSAWSSRWQQQPFLAGGDTFKSDHLLPCGLIYRDHRDPDSIVEAVEWDGVQRPLVTAEQIVISVDAASSVSAVSDRHACGVFAMWGQEAAIIEGWAKRLDYQAAWKAVLATSLRYPGAELLVESKAWGPAIVQSLREAGVGRVHLWDPGRWGSKGQRVGIASGFIRPGHFRVPTEDPHMRPWVTAYKRELVRFKEEAHGKSKDDYVDVTTQAIQWMTRVGKGMGRTGGFSAGAPARRGWARHA